MPSPLARPPVPSTDVKRAALLFSGGPAPAANAVISTAADAFLRSGLDAIGIRHGYSQLMEYDGTELEEGKAFIRFDTKELERSRTSGGITIGTARANPGKLIKSPADLKDPEKTAAFQTVYEALRSLGVDALISIGGDDTLKTANKFALFQETLPEGSPKIKVVHVPKTIDNDYNGIDFTFGFFTAVEVLAQEVRNLLEDARAQRSYFLCECMGRSAGWLAYGTAIAGGASLVISVEDIVGKYSQTETVDGKERQMMNLDAVVDRMVDTILTREKEDGREYGIICVAEGLAELLPASALEGVARDDHGHIAVADVQLGRLLAEKVEEAYAQKTGGERKVKPLQLGYESRCARPTAFDVILGSQLGVGAYRALVEEGKTGVMVSVERQFDLHYVPFEELVDPDNLVTKVRFIETGSDFHTLARFLETHTLEDRSPDDPMTNR